MSDTSLSPSGVPGQRGGVGRVRPGAGQVGRRASPVLTARCGPVPPTATGAPALASTVQYRTTNRSKSGRKLHVSSSYSLRRVVVDSSPNKNVPPTILVTPVDCRPSAGPKKTVSTCYVYEKVDLPLSLPSIFGEGGWDVKLKKYY